MGKIADLIIIGAGPFGLSLAAQASHVGLEHSIIGRPMEFWRKNMPKGMYLRSACDWHLDPLEIDTIEAYLTSIKKTAADVEPLSLEFYLSYVDWFQRRKRITPIATYVKLVNQSLDGFTVTTEDGSNLRARCVALAPGFQQFAHVPEELKDRLANGRFSHTCEFVNFASAANKRYLIIGGRQSAFEWAALLCEAGAQEVHVSHRHDSPAFAVSHWAWVKPLVDTTVDDPTWFRRLPAEEKNALNKKLWSEGRLKIEPWLEQRVATDRVKLWPRTEVVGCTTRADGSLSIRLTNEQVLSVDEVVLATGYKVEITRLPYLSAAIMDGLETSNGFPILDDHFQTSIPGLFITSIPATQDFGPFFGFTVAVRPSAKLICKAVAQNGQSSVP